MAFGKFLGLGRAHLGAREGMLETVSLTFPPNSLDRNESKYPLLPSPSFLIVSSRIEYRYLTFLREGLRVQLLRQGSSFLEDRLKLAIILLPHLAHLIIDFCFSNFTYTYIINLLIYSTQISPHHAACTSTPKLAALVSSQTHKLDNIPKSGGSTHRFPKMTTEKLEPSNDLPYSWTSIPPLLNFRTIPQIRDLILSPAFLDSWVYFRNESGLGPNANTKAKPRPMSKEFIDKLAEQTYQAMDSMAFCQFDRPSNVRTIDGGARPWTWMTYLQCCVYQICRNLACPGQPFSSAFERKCLAVQSGRSLALNRIRGIVMILCNLIYRYTTLPPSNVIRKIEELHPVADQARSPIPEIRRKHVLARMGVEELRKAVLGQQWKGKGMSEKEWLVSKLVERNAKGTINDPVVIDGDSSEVVMKSAGKRGREDEVGRDGVKKARLA
ncbi:uncharacterized protein BDR25DRAFT_355537 [Lindgomyces ingoldianus]|uniref:Uncharacterized protein n=1 Tax=Lindgomyces ingoldianus TaxID=673940 RepID=A0ACB6QTU2_9PLEO|nr:uncharacterized protein BDR25DRAFT_355537 [Lindgomyces ingoldianus]KAF2470433.1 hypothetical protein BDR25DRAFT_355537 [Lindgomyces ingoldianus]